MVWMSAFIALAVPAEAASFDCAKAGTKVERIICDTPEISKLDDELAQSYKAALQDQTKAEQIRQAQKQWMKERDGCVVADCVKVSYRNRISALTVSLGTVGVPALVKSAPRKMTGADWGRKGSYKLVMSKDDVMCSHMRQIMEDDLHLFGRTYDSNDRFVSSHKEFNAVPWKAARASSENSGQVHYRDVEGALFDLNNDGRQDYVVRYKAGLSGMNADGLYVLDSSAASRPTSLMFKELFESNNQISMAGWGYALSDPLVGRTESLWRLAPFVYLGVSYMYMQSLYKLDEVIGGDFVVIAKYIGGKFDGETTGKMEDVCYIERVDVK
jgi:uncharacterized protein YecT (DUF1311 family)